MKPRVYTGHMKEMNRLWRLRNIDSVKKKQREYSIRTREKHKKYSREYYLKNHTKILNKQKLYYQNNKSKVLAYLKRYQRVQTDTNINYRLARQLRSRMKHALRNNAKSGSAIRELGCTISEFRIYIESQFTEGMSWSNWSLRGWHLDHKIPLVKFNLSNSEEFREACHYTNIRPLWAKDNLSKGGRI